MEQSHGTVKMIQSTCLLLTFAFPLPLLLALIALQRSLSLPRQLSDVLQSQRPSRSMLLSYTVILDASTLYYNHATLYSDSMLQCYTISLLRSHATLQIFSHMSTDSITTCRPGKSCTHIHTHTRFDNVPCKARRLSHGSARYHMI